MTRTIPLRLAVAAVLTAAALTPLHAQIAAPPDDSITLEIWSIEDRIIHGDTPVEERLLREARYTLSGMIYGWDFSYIPAHRARGVERYFQLEPVGSISWGDPRLRLRDLRGVRESLYGQIDYRLSPADLQRRRAWRDLRAARAGGMGSAVLQQGLPGKLQAVEEAIHAALLAHLREVAPNRPREVRGSLALERPPRIRTVSGTYEAQVSVLIIVDEIQDYTVF